MEDGVPTTGTTVTVVLNDFSQVLEITVIRISGFNENLEVIEKIEVLAEFITALSLQSQSIPDNLINISV